MSEAVFLVVCGVSVFLFFLVMSVGAVSSCGNYGGSPGSRPNFSNCPEVHETRSVSRYDRDDPPRCSQCRSILEKGEAVDW